MTELPPIGRVYLNVFEARNLIPMDIGNSSDPYAYVTIKSADLKQIMSSTLRTKIVYKTLSPIWNDEFVFDLTHFVAGARETFYIELWDEDKISKDDFEGAACVDILDYINKGITDVWIPLTGKNNTPSKKNRGDVHIYFKYVPFNSLMDTLSSDEHSIVRHLSRQLVTDEFTKALMYYIGNYGFLVTSIKDIIKQEIETTSDPNTLFRTDSLATKLTILTFKTIGSNYLRETLQHLILNIQQNNIYLEVDPSKVDEAQCAENIGKLTDMVEKFLDAIYKSIDIVPFEIRTLCKYIYQQTGLQFPSDNTNIKAVGGIMFLRFIVPTIFSPETLSITPEAPNSNVRRTLTLISKILQNVSNQVLFGSKEDYLMSFNTTIQQHIERLSAFLIEIVTINDSISDSMAALQQTKSCLKQSLKCDPTQLAKYTDTIITAIHDKKQNLIDKPTLKKELVDAIVYQHSLIAKRDARL
ncbi:hypothetical protein CYY_004627 [Polysphondylium violaceum]|uniref:RasGTPase-activating protein n=1 Tax=Polysphondylium violaceum TaxID=133409 RepID=A0A8J4PT27_9MYCE|nr:hypothetical protein CYY_004627 [Polysphondylium violaceum]